MLLTEKMTDRQYIESDVVPYKKDKIVVLFNEETGDIKLFSLGRWTFNHFWNFGTSPTFLKRLKVVVNNNKYWEEFDSFYDFTIDQEVLKIFLSQQLNKKKNPQTQEKCPVCESELEDDKVCTGCSSYNQKYGSCLFYQLPLPYNNVRPSFCDMKNPKNRYKKKEEIIDIFGGMTEEEWNKKHPKSKWKYKQEIDE